jgi:hypothetical protein
MQLTRDNYPLGDGKADPEGPSFLMGEVALNNPIPPFSTAPMRHSIGSRIQTSTPPDANQASLLGVV